MAPINNSISDIKQEATLTARALERAQTQVGQCEVPKGSNSGPMVNEYLRAVGLGPGYAWCQAFVYWCYAQAAADCGVANTVVKTAGVQDCWNRTKTSAKITKQQALTNPKLVQPGDQFLLLFGNGMGHTGIVESVSCTPAKGKGVEDGRTDLLLHTIEGNSNNDGDREGYAVVRHVRRLDSKALQGFIRHGA